MNPRILLCYLSLIGDDIFPATPGVVVVEAARIKIIRPFISSDKSMSVTRLNNTKVLRV